MSNDYAARYRANELTGTPNPPAVVVWKCNAKPPHRVLRVFLTRTGWNVMGDSFRIPLQDWLNRVDSPYSVEDIRNQRAGAFNARRVTGVNQLLPLDVDSWPTSGRFEVGCRCGVQQVDLAALADDCRHARESRTQIVRNLP